MGGKRTPKEIRDNAKKVQRDKRFREDLKERKQGKKPTRIRV